MSDEEAVVSYMTERKRTKAILKTGNIVAKGTMHEYQSQK